MKNAIFNRSGYLFRRILSFCFLSILTLSNLPAQSIDFASNVGDGGTEELSKQITDAAGNIYVAGQISGTIFDPPHKLMSDGYFNMYIACYNPSGQLQWAIRPGGLEGTEGISDMVMDSEENIYICGESGLNFGNSDLPLGDSVFTNANVLYKDMFIAKFSKTGDFIWARHYGGNLDESLVKLGVDASDNIYALGNSYSPSLAFETGTILNPYSDPDPFAGQPMQMIVKFDKNGNEQWVKSIISDGSMIIGNFHTLPDGKTYMTGNTSGPDVDFGGGNVITNTSSGAQAFFASYTSSGAIFFLTKHTGTVQNDHRFAGKDSKDNFYIYGRFLLGSSIQFGSYTLTKSATLANYLVKYDKTGTVKWAVKIGEGNTLAPVSFMCDADGNSYLTGGAGSQAATVGSNALPSGKNFMEKIDSNGTVKWYKQADFSFINMSQFGDGDLLISGSFNKASITIDGKTVSVHGPIKTGSTYYTDPYLLRMDTTSGQVKWLFGAGGEKDDNYMETLMLPSGKVWLSGQLQSATFEIGSLQLSKKVPQDNDPDLYFAILDTTMVISAIRDAMQQQVFSVYPNPFAERICIQGNDENITLDVSVLSPEGAELYHQTYANSTEDTFIDLKNLNAGMYIIKINNSASKVFKY